MLTNIGVILVILYALKRRKIPAVTFYIGLCVSAMLYNAAYLFEFRSTNFYDAKLWYYIKYNILPFVNYFWIMISIDFVQVSKKYKKISAIVIAIPHFAFLMGINTNELHHLIFSALNYVNNGAYNVIISGKGTVLYVIYVLLGIIWVVCEFLYLRGYLKSTNFHRYGFLIMIIATCVPIIPTYLNFANKAYMNLDFTSAALVISIGIYAFGIFQYKVLRTIPIATEKVFRLSNEGIMVIDHMDCIIDVNDSFLKIYPQVKKKIGTGTLNDFMKTHAEFSMGFDASRTIQFSMTQDNEEFFYSAKIHDIFDNENAVVGHILTIHDVTLYVEKQQRLKILAEAAEFKAETNEVLFLQAQIKPHFLNNTLSVISSMIKRDPEAARRLVFSLSNFLHRSYTINSTTNMIPLVQELELVEAYVEIQKARFGERISYELICDQIPEIVVPRFILQPLIENAIQHGILTKAAGGSVYLTIYEETDRVIFEVRDNGVGINQEKIESLLNGKVHKQGIGLLNIHKRLIKYYGQGLTINSKESYGTTISLFVNHEKAKVLLKGETTI